MTNNTSPYAFIIDSVGNSIKFNMIKGTNLQNFIK